MAAKLLPPAGRRGPSDAPNRLPANQDDEGKRRRFSFETSRELAAVVAAGADCSSSTGHDSAASTSSRATATSQEEPPPVSQGVDSILRSYLASWGQRLVHLQPKVSGRAAAAEAAGIADTPAERTPTPQPIAVRLPGCTGRQRCCRTVARPAADRRSPVSCPLRLLQVYMTEHLNECGLHLFKCLRQLQVQACCEGKFPIQVRRGCGRRRREWGGG